MIASIAHAMLLFLTLVQVMESQLIFLSLVMFSVPPSILPIANEAVIEGQNVTLSCNASGFPLPTVYWVKTSNADRINKTELLFTNISRSDAGEYKCVASNQCNTSTELAEVDVLCKFIAIVFFLT